MHERLARICSIQKKWLPNMDRSRTIGSSHAGDLHRGQLLGRFFHPPTIAAQNVTPGDNADQLRRMRSTEYGHAADIVVDHVVGGLSRHRVLVDVPRWLADQIA